MARQVGGVRVVPVVNKMDLKINIRRRGSRRPSSTTRHHCSHRPSSITHLHGSRWPSSTSLIINLSPSPGGPRRHPSSSSPGGPRRHQSSPSRERDVQTTSDYSDTATHRLPYSDTKARRLLYSVLDQAKSSFNIFLNTL